MSALPQCRNASRTWIVSTVAGGRPSVNRARSSSSSRISAVPFTRTDSSTPGMTNRSPTPGFATMFQQRVEAVVPGPVRDEQRPVVGDGHEAGLAAARRRVRGPVGVRGREDDERRVRDEPPEVLVEVVELLAARPLLRLR